jgi:hypothetical protein
MEAPGFRMRRVAAGIFSGLFCMVCPDRMELLGDAPMAVLEVDTVDREQFGFRVIVPLRLLPSFVSLTVLP